MDVTEREAFRNAVEQAQRRLPKGHKLDHIRWSGGVMQFTSSGPSREPHADDCPLEFVERPKRKRSRGIMQTEMDL